MFFTFFSILLSSTFQLALKFRCQKNFNSLKAVLGGLQCTPIFRLKQTWKQVPSRYRRYNNKKYFRVFIMFEIKNITVKPQQLEPPPD